MSDQVKKTTGEYIVQSGDNLGKISKILEVPQDSLIKFNNISDKNKIQSGQRLLWRRDPTLFESIKRFFFGDENSDINEEIESNINNPSQQIKKKEFDPEIFIKNLYKSENPDSLGLKNRIWKPFKTNNNNIDIGPGIDVSKQTKKYQERANKGISEEEMHKDLLQRIDGSKTEIINLLNKRGLSFDALPQNIQEGLIDMHWQLGTKGLDEYNKMFLGLKNNDIDSVRREIMTYYYSNNKKKMVPDINRYKTRLEKYFHSLKVGGKFTPKKSQLVKNAETQNTKRDMRKKFIKSDRSTYTNNRVRKNQEGGILNQISIDPNLFSSWNAIESNIEIPTNDTNIPETKLDRFMGLLDSRPSIPSRFNIDRINTEIQDNSEVVEDTKLETKKDKPKMDMTNPSKGTEEFNRIYDEVEKEHPEAAKYRAFLTTVAKYESGFNSKAKNKNAPAWGYFQFMQDDNKYNNIKTYAGVDTQTFLNNPKLQIIAAINLAKSMEKGFSKEDMAAAESKGITKWGMLGGAWLGGNGGLRRYLLQDENISDKHWGGAGIDMINQIKRYNF